MSSDEKTTEGYQDRYRSRSTSRNTRVALRQHMEENPTEKMMAATLKFPISQNRNTRGRRLSYSVDGADPIVVNLPRNATRHEVVFPAAASVEGEVMDVDSNNAESNTIQFSFAHESEGLPEVTSNQRGVNILAMRELERPEQVEQLLGSMLPAGATGQVVEDPEENPLGGDGTVEGTMVGKVPAIPPNPNRATGVGTTIGSPPGTGTAQL